MFTFEKWVSCVVFTLPELVLIGSVLLTSPLLFQTFHNTSVFRRVTMAHSRVQSYRHYDVTQVFDYGQREGAQLNLR